MDHDGENQSKSFLALEIRTLIYVGFYDFAEKRGVHTSFFLIIIGLVSILATKAIKCD
jgi:hypothetical protein